MRKMIPVLLATLALGAATATAAQPTQVVRRTTVVEHRDVYHGPRHVRRKVCTVRWQHHRKVRRCVWR